MRSPVRITAPFAKPEETARILGVPAARAKVLAARVEATLAEMKITRRATANRVAKKRTVSRSAGAATKASGAHHGAKSVRSRKASK